MVEPYKVPVTNNATGATTWVPDPKGTFKTYWKPEMLAATFEQLILRGIDAQVHCDGDLAVRVGLDAVEAFVRRHPDKKDYRVGLAHDEVSHPDDWPRFNQLGVDAIVSFQWAAPFGGNGTSDFRSSMGDERMQRLQAFGDIAKFGRPVVYGSDWPVF